jgi:hypothetical protein
VILFKYRWERGGFPSTAFGGWDEAFTFPVDWRYEQWSFELFLWYLQSLVFASKEGTMPKDKSGTSYTSPNNKPATYGTPVKINTSTGPKPGTMGSGNYVIPTKKK